MKKKYYIVQIFYRKSGVFSMNKLHSCFRLSCALSEDAAKEFSKDYFNTHYGKKTVHNSKFVSAKIIPVI